jgi:hypothetical protein
MSPLPSQEELRRRKAVEQVELERSRKWEAAEKRGLEESCVRYWELLEEFVARARELGIRPQTHASDAHVGGRIAWVEGFRLRSGSVVTAPPLTYCVRERRRVAGARTDVRAIEEVSVLVVMTDAGLSTGLSEPKTASSRKWPPFKRWDRAANILIAVEAELEATLLELMEVSP